MLDILNYIGGKLMFNQKHYVPVIKWKRGERKALENLPSDSKQHITPLFEIQPIPYDHQNHQFKKGLDEHLSSFASDLCLCFDTPKHIFIDAYTIYNDSRLDPATQLTNGLYPLEYVITAANQSGFIAIPVTSLLRYRYEEYHESILNHTDNGVALRLFPLDLEDYPNFISQLNMYVERLGIERNSIDIIIDLEEIDPKTPELVLQSIISTLARFPSINEWRTLTIISTSMTENLSAIETGTNTSIPRVEWNIYKEILKSNLTRFPTYGDYTIGHPSWFDFNPIIMNPGAKIKYTVDNHFLIFRGLGTRNRGLSQMQPLCQDVVQHPDYLGRAFSYGDGYIFDCAHGSESTGNPETWVRVTVNHHLAFIINSITSYPFPSISQTQ